MANRSLMVLVIVSSSALLMVKGQDTTFDVNVALRKPARQSSTYLGQARWGDTDKFNYDASLAVDGNDDTNFQQNSCSHTDAGQSSAWWEVDLERLYSIAGIKIYQRSGQYLYRNAGSTVSGKLGNDSYEVLTILNGSEVFTFNVDSSNIFKGIRVDHSGWNDVYICLCEVKVFVVIRCSIPLLNPTVGTYACTERVAGGCTYKSMLTIQCNTGYKLSGYNSSQCIDTDHWDRDVGVCVAITCNMPPLNQTMGTYECKERVVGQCAYNSILTIQCNSGYKLSGYNSSQCIGTDHWNRIIGVCDLIDCGWPEDVPNDVPMLIMPGIAGGFSYNATVCIQSNEWIRKLGDIYETMRCSSEGYWKGSLRKCSEITNKESYMNQDGKNIILPIAVLVPICLILIATNVVTFLKHRRYACYQGHPSEQIQVDNSIADQFGSSQDKVTKREQTRFSHTNGDTELQRRKRGPETIHSQGTGPYDELQKAHIQNSEYDELQFKRDLTSKKGTIYENTFEIAQI